MRFYNSRNSNFVMKFRRNCDIDLYFGNIFLQFPINIDFNRVAVVSLSAPIFILIDHRPLELSIAHRWAVAPTLGTVDVML